MTPIALSTRFLDTTRGQVIALLRRGPRTVEDLAQSLSLTDNAIRSHLSTLERDGLIRQKGVRRGPGAGKPATIYEVHPGTEPMLSQAYVPVLGALLDELAEQLPSDRSESLMKAVGHRLAAGIPRNHSGSIEIRVATAVAFLNSLGGDAQAERDGENLVIRGCGCPLSAATARRPEVCKAMEALLSDVIGVPVEEACDRGERPQCQFIVNSAA